LKAEKTLISSYDAIRVYLWAGMMHDGDPQKARLLARFKPMATLRFVLPINDLLMKTDTSTFLAQQIVRLRRRDQIRRLMQRDKTP
ncbi:glycosyl hydrolase family 8, partial [Salmonella enterica subsp. enterica serovar Kentucky]|nr:glycosyl hydrolase family 8 [Salmonella enterica subsp. enterica serovar Kentucky]